MYGGGGCINSRILDQGNSWSWVVSFTPGSLYPPVSSPRYPLGRRLAGLHDGYGWRGKEKNQATTGNSNSDPSAVQPLASRYTDCDILALRMYNGTIIYSREEVWLSMGFWIKYWIFRTLIQFESWLHLVPFLISTLHKSLLHTSVFSVCY
jgi:hypothetical protein